MANVNVNVYYRRRSRKEISDDLAWLRRAREAFRAADAAAFPNEAWPIRAPKMDRMIKALGVLQHMFFNAIEEAEAEMTGSTPRLGPHDDNNWLGYRPPRR